MIPILKAHDVSQPPIGKVETNPDGSLQVTFFRECHITEDLLFLIFGNAGFRVTESEMSGNTRVILAGTILEFSL